MIMKVAVLEAWIYSSLPVLYMTKMKAQERKRHLFKPPPLQKQG